jgi:alpha-beta hydrolase superfamily lysophospholipase
MTDIVRRGHGEFAGAGKVRLAYRRWEGAVTRAVLLVVHGLGEHAGRYDEFASRMASCGITTFAFDLRGHGLSDGRRGHVTRFDVYLQDLKRFRSEVVSLTSIRTPPFLLGQSMGGLIALRYLQEFGSHFAGAVICSPWLATAVEVPRWKTLAAPLLARLLPTLPFRHGLAPEDLSRDPAVVEAYRTDPLVHGRITPRTFVEVSAAMDLVPEHSSAITRPLLLLVGDADRVVDSDRTIALAQHLVTPDKTTHVFPGQLHELLNEADRASTHSLVGEWISARA